MHNLTARKAGFVFQTCLYSLTFLIALVLIVPTTTATEFLKGKDIHLTNLHRIDGDVYAAGSDISIDGSIDGDLLATGGTVTATGETGGSMMIFAGKFFHTGRTEGSIRMFVERGEIEGFVGRSILFLGRTLEIHRGAVIRGDVNAYGFRVQLDGQVMGDVTIKAEEIEISGQIDGNVDLETERVIIIRPPAIIHGNLTYTSADELDLDDESGITVLGEITRLEPVDSDQEETEGATDTALRFSRLFAAFLFGLILIWLFPTYLSQAFDKLRSRFMASLVTGLVTAAAVVMCLLVLVVAILLSVVGLILSTNDQPVGGMLLLIFSTLTIPVTSFACVSGGLLFYIGKLLPAWLLGYGIFRIFRKTPKQLGKWQLLIGLLILTGLYVPPGGGMIFYLLSGILGTGAIVLAVKDRRLKPRLDEEEPVLDDSASDDPPSPPPTT